MLSGIIELLEHLIILLELGTPVGRLLGMGLFEELVRVLRVELLLHLLDLLDVSVAV